MATKVAETSTDVGQRIRVLTEKRRQLVDEQIALSARRAQLQERAGAAVVEAGDFKNAIREVGDELARLASQDSVAAAAIADLYRRLEVAKGELHEAGRREAAAEVAAIDEELDAAYERLIPPMREVRDLAVTVHEKRRRVSEIVSRYGTQARHANSGINLERIEHFLKGFEEDLTRAKAQRPAASSSGVLAHAAAIVERAVGRHRDDEWTAS